MKYFAKIILVVFFLLLDFSVSHAEELPAIDRQTASAAPDSFNLWVTPGFLSYHVDRDAGYRNRNYGYGVQTDLSDQMSLMAGSYINSDNNRSDYVGLSWQPLSWHSIKIGVATGVLNGYRNKRGGGGGAFTMVVPWVSIRNKRIGVNFTLMPDDAGNLCAIAMQLTLRIW